MAPKPISPTLISSPFWIAAPSLAFSEKDEVPFLLKVTSPSAFISRAITFPLSWEIKINMIINNETVLDVVLLFDKLSKNYFLIDW